MLISSRTTFKKNETRWILVSIILLVFAIVLRRTAWVCDDAYITFRTVDNFINGYGLRWNILTRVQSYTNPLWMLLVSVCYFVTHQMYYTVNYLSIVVSLTTIMLFSFFVAYSAWSALGGAIILLFSRSFIDYSTSGLENPLTHLFITIFLGIYFRYPCSKRTLFLLSLTASLAMVNRMDTILYFVPALIYVWKQTGEVSSYKYIIRGFIPFIIWELFAVIYYGFPFPNSFYSKLCAGIPIVELISQGFYYVGYSVTNDIVTIVTIICGIIVPIILRKKEYLPLIIGLISYILYVIRIGGDFMGGRFFSSSIIWSVILLATLGIRFNKTLWIGVCISVVVLGFTVSSPPILSNNNYGITKDDYTLNHGIADERAEYYPATGLLNACGKILPDYPTSRQGEFERSKGVHTIRFWMIGFLGFHAGQDVHIVDEYGLCDAFIARLPAKVKPHWRIGHLLRTIPDGYLSTIKHKQRFSDILINHYPYRINMISDKNLAYYYNRLSVIISGRLFSIKRFIEIIKMNFGSYDYLIEQTTL